MDTVQFINYQEREENLGVSESLKVGTLTCNQEKSFRKERLFVHIKHKKKQCLHLQIIIETLMT